MAREKTYGAPQDKRRGHQNRGSDKIRRRYRINLWAMQRLCELNYKRLLTIAGETLCDQVDTTLLLSHRHFTSKLTVCEQTRYTTVISLVPEKRQQNRDTWLSSNQPHLMVRLYHDVRMAEVIAANQYRNLAIYYDYPNTYMHQPDEKYQLNHLLAEWLELYSTVL